MRAIDVLEAMMIGHRDAMLMLREAIHHQLFYRGSALAACGDPAADRVMCWVRFQGTLHGPWMELQPESVECGVRNDEVLASCILDRLALRDPLGPAGEARTVTRVMTDAPRRPDRRGDQRAACGCGNASTSSV